MREWTAVRFVGCLPRWRADDRAAVRCPGLPGLRPYRHEKLCGARDYVELHISARACRVWRCWCMALLANFGPVVLTDFGPPPSLNLRSPDCIGGPGVDWRAKVDLFEQLRREHEFGVGTIAGVAAKFGVHRRVVRQAIGSALPPRRRYPSRAKPKLGAVVDFIDKVLEADRQAPRKQRHTARRIYRRILTEFPDAAVAESTVRNHVRERKRQMGLAATGDVCSAKLWLGSGGAGRLV